MNNTSTYDSVYQVKLAQIAALQGDTTKKYDSVYQTELEMLKLLKAGVGAQINDYNVSTGTVWSSYKTLSEIRTVSDKYLTISIGEEWTEEKANTLNELVTEYGTRLQDHLFYQSNFPGNGYIACTQYNSSTKTASFLEYYQMPGAIVSGELFYSEINLNISVGSTIQLGNRYQYVGGDRLYVREQLYTKNEINSKLDIIDTSIHAFDPIIIQEGDILTQELYDHLMSLSNLELIQKLYFKPSDPDNALGYLRPCRVYKTQTSIFVGMLYNKHWVTLNNTIQPSAIGNAIIFKTEEFLTVNSGYKRAYIDSSLNNKVDTSTFDGVVEDLQNALQQKANSSDVYTKVQVDSLVSEKVISYNVVEIKALTTEEYEAIEVKDPSVMYVITDASI